MCIKLTKNCDRITLYVFFKSSYVGVLYEDHSVQHDPEGAYNDRGIQHDPDM